MKTETAKHDVARRIGMVELPGMNVENGVSSTMQVRDHQADALSPSNLTRD
jgi:hypothetical protein